jgi:predicted metal-dependent hydrolase
MSRVRARRLLRGRKHIVDEAGQHHALREIYREVNRNYFNSQVEVRKVGWGTRRSWSRLGHYDPIHNTITISPVLDSPRVPKSVVSYLLYHEMLHTVYDEAAGKIRRRRHTAEFRRAERAFPQHAAIGRFLRRFCETRGRSRPNTI